MFLQHSVHTSPAPEACSLPLDVPLQAALASSAPLRSTLVDGQGWDPSTFWQVGCRRVQAAQQSCAVVLTAQKSHVWG